MVWGRILYSSHGTPAVGHEQLRDGVVTLAGPVLILLLSEGGFGFVVVVRPQSVDFVAATTTGLTWLLNGAGRVLGGQGHAGSAPATGNEDVLLGQQGPSEGCFRLMMVVVVDEGLLVGGR